MILQILGSLKDMGSGVQGKAYHHETENRDELSFQILSKNAGPDGCTWVERPSTFSYGCLFQIGKAVLLQFENRHFRQY